jgi:hypothetical protein
MLVALLSAELISRLIAELIARGCAAVLWRRGSGTYPLSLLQHHSTARGRRPLLSHLVTFLNLRLGLPAPGPRGVRTRIGKNRSWCHEHDGCC